MEIDVGTLRWAKVPNLERLARALGVPLPVAGSRAAYVRRLTRAVAMAIENDKRHAAAEERRAMDKAQAQKVAVEIAALLGETGERPIAQIARIVGLMGAEWTRDRFETSRAFHRGERGESALSNRLLCRGDGKRRTFGGVFFEVCRWAARDRVRPERPLGDITRRDFFRCFYDNPPKPRTKTAAPLKPVRPNGKKARRDVTHNWGAPRTRDQREPEVYNVVRRSVGQRAGRA